MRWMILNPASLVVPDERTAALWMRDLVSWIGSLSSAGVAMGSLHTDGRLFNLRCLDGSSMSSPYTALRGIGARDAANRINQYLDKTPPILEHRADLFGNMEDYIATECGSISLAGEDGDPLLRCVFVDGIAVSFPSDTLWRQNRLPVRIKERIDTEAGLESVYEVDNLSCEAHSEQLLKDHLGRLREFESIDDLWQKRDQAFPNLTFGQDVRKHLESLDHGLLHRLTRRLEMLNDYAQRWTVEGGQEPPWGDWVRPEGETVLTNPAMRRERIHKSNDGTNELYVLKVSLTGLHRIHLRIDRSSFLVEVGYIGRHLTTKKY